MAPAARITSFAASTVDLGELEPAAYCSRGQDIVLKARLTNTYLHASN